MTSRERVSSRLREIPDAHFVEANDLVYPVVSPCTAEAAAQVLQIADDEGYRAMLMGTGSSFAEDFSPATDQVIAVFSAQLTGLHKVSAFSTLVRSGTRLEQVVSRTSGFDRKTVGGLLCDEPRRNQALLLHALWSRIIRVHVFGGGSRLHVLSGPRGMTDSDPAMASVFLASRGRLGMIAAVELSDPVPFEIGSSVEQPVPFGEADLGESALSVDAVRSVFDPDGLFRW